MYRLRVICQDISSVYNNSGSGNALLPAAQSNQGKKKSNLGFSTFAA